MSLTVVLTAYDAHFQHCAQTMDPNLFLKHVTLDHVIIGVVAFISIIYYLVPSLWGPVLITFCSVVLLFAWKRSREFWETWQESARKRQHAKREAHNSASTASTSPSSRPRRRSDKADSGDETLEASDSQPSVKHYAASPNERERALIKANAYLEWWHRVMQVQLNNATVPLQVTIDGKLRADPMPGDPNVMAVYLPFSVSSMAVKAGALATVIGIAAHTYPDDEWRYARLVKGHFLVSDSAAHGTLSTLETYAICIPLAEPLVVGRCQYIWHTIRGVVFFGLIAAVFIWLVVPAGGPTLPDSGSTGPIPDTESSIPV